MASGTGTILIPAMGRSQRFRDAGYTRHKALLSVSSPYQLTRPMLSWVLESVPADWSVTIIAPESDLVGFRSVISEFKIDARVLTMSGETSGQSQTILRGLMSVDKDRPVGVLNCDVALSIPAMLRVLGPDDSVVGVHSHGYGEPKFSYVLESEGRAVEFAEKRRIGPLAQTGIWRFQSASVLAEALRRQIMDNVRHTNGEFYLSGALNLLPGGLCIAMIEPTEWVDMGTPESIKAMGGTCA